MEERLFRAAFRAQRDSPFRAGRAEARFSFDPNATRPLRQAQGRHKWPIFHISSFVIGRRKMEC